MVDRTSSQRHKGYPKIKKYPFTYLNKPSRIALHKTWPKPSTSKALIDHHNDIDKNKNKRRLVEVDSDLIQRSEDPMTHFTRKLHKYLYLDYFNGLLANY